jgi:hypothetical protein
MTKGQLACIGFLLLLLLAAALLDVMRHCPLGEFAVCNYRQIRAGMTRAEVEYLLGPGTEIEHTDLPQVARPKAGAIVPKRLDPRATARDYPVDIVPAVEGDQFFR